jgi:hypothetical protein
MKIMKANSILSKLSGDGQLLKIQVLQAPFALEIKLFSHRIGCQSTTELLEDLTVNLTEHHGGMHLTTIEQWQALKRLTTVLIRLTENSQSDKHLIRMQTRIVTMQHRGLHPLDRLNHLLRDQLQAMLNTSQVFNGIEDESSTRT